MIITETYDEGIGADRGNCVDGALEDVLEGSKLRVVLIGIVFDCGMSSEGIHIPINVHYQMLKR